MVLQEMKYERDQDIIDEAEELLNEDEQEESEDAEGFVASYKDPGFLPLDAPVDEEVNGSEDE